MILDFNQIKETVFPNFKGGDKEFQSQMYADEQIKIMRGRLKPGANIGFHTHETNSEIIFMLKGTGVVLYDEEKETLQAGCCHYCPKGHSHSLRNDSDEEIEFYAVVPEQ